MRCKVNCALFWCTLKNRTNQYSENSVWSLTQSFDFGYSFVSYAYEGPQGVRSLLVGNVMVVIGDFSEGQLYEDDQVLHVSFFRRKGSRNVEVTFSCKEKELIETSLERMEAFINKNKEEFESEEIYSFEVVLDTEALSFRKIEGSIKSASKFCKRLRGRMLTLASNLLQRLDEKEVNLEKATKKLRGVSVLDIEALDCAFADKLKTCLAEIDNALRAESLFCDLKDVTGKLDADEKKFISEIPTLSKTKKLIQELRELLSQDD